MNLQKTCTAEQVKQHKSIKDQKLEPSDFEGYCKCEAEFIVEHSTKEQLNQIFNKQDKNPSWLKRLKSNALKSCFEQKQQTIT